MERDDKGRYVKGHTPSCNGGRPFGLAVRCRAAVADGADLVQFYLQVFRGLVDSPMPQEDGTIDYVKAPVKLELRMEAASWLADRGWGKAKQSDELTVKGDNDAPLKVIVEYVDSQTD
jgi:hypothetical protein